MDSGIPFTFAVYKQSTMGRLLVICMIACFFSCTKGYRITGESNVTRLEGKTVTLKTADGDAWLLLDSCEVLHGRFRMAGRVDSPLIATLFLDGSPILPVIVEPGQMDVVISNIHLGVSGTPLNDSLYRFIARKYKLDVRAMELDRLESQMIMNGYGEAEIQVHLDSAYQVLGDEMQQLVCGFIGSNYHNVLGLCGFSMLCNGLPYPVITPLIQSVVNDAPQVFLQHPAVSKFLQVAHENTERYGLADVEEY